VRLIWCGVVTLDAARHRFARRLSVYSGR
jgi:hypothetical protein